MGGREETKVPIPALGEFGIPENMPDRIGIAAAQAAPVYKLHIRGNFTIGKAVVFPAEKLALRFRRRNSLK